MNKRKLINLLCVPFLMILVMMFVACDGNMGGGGGQPTSLGMYGEIADFFADHSGEYDTWEDAAMAYVETKLPAEYELIMRFTNQTYLDGVVDNNNSDIREHKYVKTAEGWWLEQTKIVNESPSIEGGFKLKSSETPEGDDTIYLYDSDGYVVVDNDQLADAKIEVSTMKAALFSVMTWYGQFGTTFEVIEQAMGILSSLGLDLNALLAEDGITFEINRNASQTVDGRTFSCDMYKITEDDTVLDPDASSPTYNVMECYVDKANGICLKMSNTNYVAKNGDKCDETIIETRTFKTSNVDAIQFPNT